MRWRRRARERRLQELDDLLTHHQLRILEETTLLLLDAMAPMAEAMQRQDSLLELLTDAIEKKLEMNQEELTELLMEVLSSLQPTAREMLLPHGSTQLPPSLESALSARRSRTTSSTATAAQPTSRR